MHFLMVFDFTQFWLDGWPGNEYFWIPYKIYGLLTPLTPLTPLGVRPQWFETDLSHSSYSEIEVSIGSVVRFLAARADWGREGRGSKTLMAIWEKAKFFLARKINISGCCLSRGSWHTSADGDHCLRSFKYKF